MAIECGGCGASVENVVAYRAHTCKDAPGKAIEAISKANATYIDLKGNTAILPLDKNGKPMNLWNLSVKMTKTRGLKAKNYHAKLKTLNELPSPTKPQTVKKTSTKTKTVTKTDKPIIKDATLKELRDALHKAGFKIVRA